MILITHMKARDFPPREPGRAWIYIIGFGVEPPITICKVGVTTDLAARMSKRPAINRRRRYFGFFHCAYAAPNDVPRKIAESIESRTQAKLSDWSFISHDYFLIPPQDAEGVLRATIREYLGPQLPLVRFPS